MTGKDLPVESTLCVILGGGGHASVVIDTIRSARIDLELVILDPDRAKWGEKVGGVPVLGGDERLPELADRGAVYFLVGLGSTGDNLPRKRLFETALSHGLLPLKVAHPSAVLSPWAKVDPGSVLLPGSVVNAGTSLGQNVIVNSAAVVEHDCVIGDHVHVATGACLAAAVRVGECAHIGVGAVVRQGLSIGERSVVGAGAVVVKDVPPGTMAIGVPARSLKASGMRAKPL